MAGAELPRTTGGGGRTTTGEYDVALPKLLFAFLGAAVIWSVHFGAIYFVVALFCTAGWAGATAVILALTAVSTVISVLSGLVAYREWRRLRPAGRGLEDGTIGVADPHGRTTVLLVMGVMGSVLFTLFIVLEGLSPLFVPLCSGAGT